MQVLGTGIVYAQPRLLQDYVWHNEESKKFMFT